MSSIVTPCSIYAGTHTPCPITTKGQYSSGSEIERFISSRPLPEEFENECRNYRDYNLTMGCRGTYNALCIAAELGNIHLVEYLVKVSKKKLLNVGTEAGCTPLFCAVVTRQFGATNKLLELGADVNMSTIMSFKVSWRQLYPSRDVVEDGTVAPLNATPLWRAASDRQCDIALVKLLLRNNGVVNPPLDAYGTQNIEKAKQQIAEESLHFYEIINADSKEHILHDLTKIIEDYARCLLQVELNRCQPDIGVVEYNGFNSAGIKKDDDEKRQYEPSKPAESNKNNNQNKPSSCTVM